jgi:hypothetical protein
MATRILWSCCSSTAQRSIWTAEKGNFFQRTHVRACEQPCIDDGTGNCICILREFYWIIFTLYLANLAFESREPLGGAGSGILGFCGAEWRMTLDTHFCERRSLGAAFLSCAPKRFRGLSGCGCIPSAGHQVVDDIY